MPPEPTTDLRFVAGGSRKTVVAGVAASEPFRMVTTTVALAAGIFAILVLSMSIGIFFGRPRLRGSCGGVGGAGACSVCGAGAESECRKEH